MVSKAESQQCHEPSDLHQRMTFLKLSFLISKRRVTPLPVFLSKDIMEIYCDNAKMHYKPLKGSKK